MSSSNNNWTTVSNVKKAKQPSTSSSTLPKAEVKNIKLSDSAFSAMKHRLSDDDDDQENEVPTVKTNPPTKVTKPTKPSSSTGSSFKQLLENIKVDKLKQLFESSKENSALRMEKVCYWFIEQVKDATSGTNDPIFSKENHSDYPLNALPVALRDYFEEIFDTTKSKLEAIALCRSKMLQANTSDNIVTGYQVLLQYFLRNLHERPSNAFLDEIDEFSNSLKRYPSERVLRLIWVYSQVQYEQPSLALSIWFRLMFPLLENRAYNQFVIEILSQLTKRNLQNKKFFKSNEPFPVESYLRLLDLIDRAPPSLSKELRSTLSQSAAQLSEIFLNNSKNISTHGKVYFSELFAGLTSDKSRSSKSQSIIDRMILATMTDKSIVETWFSLHQRYPQNSAYLLSLLNDEENLVGAFSSSKELRQIAQRLQNASSENTDQTNHGEFLRSLTKNSSTGGKKRRSQSKSKTSALFKFIVIVALTLIIVQNWLWLTVATEYLFEDYLKHPTAVVMKKQLSTGLEEGKRLTQLSIKYGIEYAQLTVQTLHPYAIQASKHLQKQWTLIVKYLEGPVYDKTVEIAEEIQKLSIVVFQRSTVYLTVFFDHASYYAAQAAHLTEIYLKQVSAMLYDQWMNFDGSALRKKFDELRLRVVKSI